MELARHTERLLASDSSTKCDTSPQCFPTCRTL